MPKRNGCRGKRKHKSRIAALIVAKKIKHAGMNVYKCPECGAWHLGKSRNPDRIQARLDQLFDKIHKQDVSK